MHINFLLLSLSVITPFPYSISPMYRIVNTNSEPQTITTRLVCLPSCLFASDLHSFLYIDGGILCTKFHLRQINCAHSLQLQYNLIACPPSNDLSWLLTTSIQKQNHRHTPFGKESNISRINCDIFSGVAEKKSADV